MKKMKISFLLFTISIQAAQDDYTHQVLPGLIPVTERTARNRPHQDAPYHVPSRRQRGQRTLPTAPTPYKWTALHTAAQDGNVGNIYRLLQIPHNPQQGMWPANPNKQEPVFLKTPTFVATEYNNPATLIALLSNGRTNPNIPNRNGVTPLFLAVERAFSECVKHLTEHSTINCNVTNSDGYTPLFFTPTEEIAEFLVKGGADHTYLAPNGTTPIQALRMQGKFNIADAIERAAAEKQVTKEQREAVRARMETAATLERTHSKRAAQQTTSEKCPLCQESTENNITAPFTCGHSLHADCWQEVQQNGFGSSCLLCNITEFRSHDTPAIQETASQTVARLQEEQREMEERDYLAALALAVEWDTLEPETDPEEEEETVF